MAPPLPAPVEPLPASADPCVDLQGLAAPQLALMARFGVQRALVPLHLPRALETSEEWVDALAQALARLRERVRPETPRLFPMVSLAPATLPRRAHADLPRILRDFEPTRALASRRGDAPLLLHLPMDGIDLGELSETGDAALAGAFGAVFRILARLAPVRPLRVVIPAASLAGGHALERAVGLLNSVGISPDSLLISGVDYLLLRPALDAGAWVAVDCGGRLRATEAVDLVERFGLQGAPRVGLSVGGGPSADVLGIARFADEVRRRGWASDVDVHLRGAVAGFLGT